MADREGVAFVLGGGGRLAEAIDWLFARWRALDAWIEDRQNAR